MISADQSIYLCYPKGYEERTTAIIASNDAEASYKAMLNPGIKEAVELLGGELKMKNLSQAFSKQGYNIYIQLEGNYH